MNTDNEEIEKENNLIKKFSFTFDDENQIVLPEVGFNQGFIGVHYTFISSFLFKAGSNCIINPISTIMS